MRFCTFTSKGVRSFGVFVDADSIIDLPRAAAAAELVLPDSLEGLIAGGDRVLDTVERLHALCRTQDPPEREESELRKLVLRAANLRLEAPVVRPSKVVAVGLNYMDHCREQKVQPPSHPVLFAKFPSAITGPYDTIRWDGRLSSQVDFEAELAVIIGKRARQVTPEWALRYVFGYAALNDVSARDVQFGDKQWVRGKSFDTFCPIGPWIVTTDEIQDPGSLAITCQVNGKTFQRSNTSEMIVKVPELVAFISEGITLEPGDIIATGTPNGVGAFRTPKVFLKNGDEVVVEIERIGALHNRVEVY